VRATNAAGSTDSPVIRITVAESVPASVPAPSISPVSGRYDQLMITWTAPRRPNGLIRYYILQRNASTAWNVNTSTDDVLLEYVDRGLQADTIYSYTVTACTSAGCTSSTSSTSRTNENVPSSVSPPVATALNSTAVRLSWTSPTQTNGRMRRYLLIMNGTVIYSGLATTQVVTSLEPYVLYEFAISACTSAGCTPSRSTLARPDEDLPTDLSAPSVRVTGTRSMEVSWTSPVKPNGIITAYELRRNGSLIQLTAGTWYVDYDCQPRTTYSYQVTAYNSVGGVDSPATFATTWSSAPDGIRPPTLAALSSTHVAVSWRVPALPNGQIVNYTVYMDHDVVYTGLSLSTVVRDLSPWTSYSFRVSACTLSGCTVSNDAHVKTLEAPPAGLGQPRLTASAVGQVLVEWAAPQSSNGVIIRYELYRRAVNGTNTQGSVYCYSLFSHQCSLASRADVPGSGLRWSAYK